MARTNPWRRDLTTPFFALQSELNRLFDEYVSPGRFAGDQASPVDLEPASWIPAIDQRETSEAYVITADIPGVDPSSVDLSLTGNVLTIRGIKPDDHGGEPTETVRERRFGPFHRQLVLSSDVDFESAQAEARNGVLKIKLPKREAAKPRTIPIHSGA